MFCVGQSMCQILSERAVKVKQLRSNTDLVAA